jgi:hypothetical protein
MKRLFPLMLLTALSFIACCPEDDEPESPNLICNWSFEDANHDSSFVCWYSTVFLPGPVDNPMAPLVQDAPPDGGEWSLFLMPLWFPMAGYAETFVTGQIGNQVYELSAWMKNYNWIGTMSLQQWRNGQMIHEKMLSDSSYVWKHYSFTDTINIEPTDTLRVFLNAGSTEVAWGHVNYDLVSLKVVMQPGE